jgi:hypothetical protein
MCRNSVTVFAQPASAVNVRECYRAEYPNSLYYNVRRTCITGRKSIDRTQVEMKMEWERIFRHL